MQALRGGMTTYLSLVFKWFSKIVCVGKDRRERQKESATYTKIKRII